MKPFITTPMEGLLGGSVSKWPILDFGSGHDLRVCGFEPRLRLHTVQILLGSLFLSLPLPCLCSVSQNQSINKLKKKITTLIETPPYQPLTALSSYHVKHCVTVTCIHVCTCVHIITILLNEVFLDHILSFPESPVPCSRVFTQSKISVNK